MTNLPERIEEPLLIFDPDGSLAIFQPHPQSPNLNEYIFADNKLRKNSSEANKQ
jgi:hypothetical protein